MGFSENITFNIQKQKMIQDQIRNIKGDLNNSISLKNSIPLIKKMAIFMLTGGDFSFAVYHNLKEVMHVSQHKYVIRKKGGGKQSTKDKTKKIASIGSQIRRENEKILLLNVEKSIKDNSKLLQECAKIFVYAPGLNKNQLIEFFEDSEIDPGLIRTIMITRKANYSSIQEVIRKLSHVYVF